MNLLLNKACGRLFDEYRLKLGSKLDRLVAMKKVLHQYESFTYHDLVHCRLCGDVQLIGEFEFCDSPACGWLCDNCNAGDFTQCDLCSEDDEAPTQCCDACQALLQTCALCQGAVCSRHPMINTAQGLLCPDCQDERQLPAVAPPPCSNGQLVVEILIRRALDAFERRLAEIKEPIEEAVFSYLDDWEFPPFCNKCGAMGVETIYCETNCSGDVSRRCRACFKGANCQTCGKNCHKTCLGACSACQRLTCYECWQYHGHHLDH